MADFPVPPPPTAPQETKPAIAPAPMGGPKPVGKEDPELQQSLNTVVLTPDDLSDWWARIKASETRTKNREEDWDSLLDEYTPKVSKQGMPEDVKANSHFRNIHTKQGQLFVRSPEVILTPQGPALDQVLVVDATGIPRPQTPEEAVPIRQAVINKYMSREFIDGVRLMDECTLDMMAWSGICGVEIEYEALSRTVDQPVMGPDPTFQPQPQGDSVLGLRPQVPPQVPMKGPDGQPLTKPTPVIIFETVSAFRFSPKKLLLDDLLHSPRVEQNSRWIGRRFFLSARIAARKWGLDYEELKTKVAPDDRHAKQKDDEETDAQKDLVTGVRVWYKAAHFTDDDHPQAINELVLLDCYKEKTIVSRKSNHQTFDEKGALTYNSLIGFPIKVGSLRDFPDSPFALADSAFTNALAKQLDICLQQAVKLRDAAIGKYFYDTDAIDERDLDTMKGGEVGEYIALKAGALLQGADKIFYTTAQVKATADDYRLVTTLQSIMNQTLGISEVQAGSNPDTVRSATEIQDVQANAAGRQEKERSRVIGLYLDIISVVDCFLFRYFTGERWVAVVGEDGAKKLAKWSKKLGAGCYSYEIKPNSQFSIDASRDAQQELATYTAMAPDPLTNRAPILREIARTRGWDPSRIVLDPAVVAAQQQQQAMGMPGGGQPPMGAKSGGTEGPKHQQERSGRNPNEPSAAGPGDNRQERNPRPSGRP